MKRNEGSGAVGEADLSGEVRLPTALSQEAVLSNLRAGLPVLLATLACAVAYGLWAYAPQAGKGPADAPYHEGSSLRVAVFSLLVLSGICLAALTVYLKAKADDTIRSVRGERLGLGLPVLALVPITADDHAVEAALDQNSKLSVSLEEVSAELVRDRQPGESHVIMLSSAEASVGKSIACLALAHRLARAGQSVLVVDAGLHRPALHRVADLDNDRGLTEVLAGRGTLETSVRVGEAGGPAYLTSGPKQNGLMDLILSPRMGQLMLEAKRAYDFILIDSPAMDVGEYSQALSVLADTVVLVAALGRTRMASLKLTLGCLNSVQDKVLGLVLTS